MKRSRVSKIVVSYKDRVKIADAPTVTGSRIAHSLFREEWDDDMNIRESFYIMLLNKANKVKGVHLVSKGGLSGTVVDAKYIFGLVVSSLSSSFVIAHNHPSGNLRPSQTDIELTKKLEAGAKLLDSTLLDHLIIVPDRFVYTSFADEGIIYK